MKTIPHPRISLGIAILTMALGAHSVKASTTYTYTGNDFTTAVAPFTTSDSVQGSFTIATLGDNLTFDSIAPTTYTFSDGVTTINQTDGTIAEFTVSTNGVGAIILWDIDVVLNPGTGTIETETGPSVDSGETFAGFGEIVNDPGTWGTTPEPSTFILMSSGLLALTMLARKRTFHGPRPTPQLLR
jgi:hypothetical protein